MTVLGGDLVVIVLAVVGALAVLYLVSVGMLYRWQNTLLFAPTRTMQTSPKHFAIERYDDIEFTSADGMLLHGWWVAAAAAGAGADAPPRHKHRGAVLLCHGRASDVSGTLARVRQLHCCGLDVFTFDYRGFGRSSRCCREQQQQQQQQQHVVGRAKRRIDDDDDDDMLSEQTLYRDAEAAWHCMRQCVARTYPTVTNSVPLLVYGYSLGGGVAAWLAQRHWPAMLVLDSTFTSLPAALRHWLPVVPVCSISRATFPVARRLTSLGDSGVPVLFVHAQDDDVIPPTHANELYARYTGGPKRLLLLPRGGHAHAVEDNAAVFRNTLVSFMKRTLVVTPTPPVTTAMATATETAATINSNAPVVE